MILIGFVFVLLIGIPVTVFLVQQQQQTQSQATKATNLTLTPANQSANVGDNVNVSLNVDPGGNQVSFIKFSITYDPALLKPADTPFTLAAGSPLTILQGPTITGNSISVTLSIGAAFQNAIQTATTVGSFGFQTLGPGTANITFDTGTQVRSLGATDTATENVLSNAAPATIVIAGSPVTPTPSPTPIPSETPTPSPEPSLSPSPSASPTPITVTNASPVCQSLSLDKAASGTAPYTLMFTANAADTDGTITKVTFNYGDGTTADLTQGGSSASAQIEHTYNSAGTFTSTAIFTDNLGATSNPSTCTQTITVTSNLASNPGTGTGTTSTTQTGTGTGTGTIPTLTPAGPGQTILGIGAIGAGLSILGLLLFLAL